MDIDLDRKSPIQEGDHRTEPEPTRESGLPRISEFPHKIRPVIEEAFHTVEGYAGKVHSLARTARVICTIKDQQVPNGVEATKKRLEDPEQESQKIADQQAAQVERELLLLINAYSKLTEGKDAPELRKIATPFQDLFISSVQFSEDELKKFGAGSKNPLHRARAFVRTVRANADERKKFSEKNPELFRDRVTAFLRGSIGGESPYLYQHVTDSIFSELHKKAAQDPLAVSSDDIEAAYADYFKNAEQKAMQLTVSQKYVQQVELVIQRELSTLMKIDRSGRIPFKGEAVFNKLGEILQRELKQGKNSLAIQTRDFINELENNPSDQAQRLLHLYLDSILPEVREINTASEPMGGDKPSEYSNASLSQDMVNKTVQLQAALEPMLPSAGNYHSLDESIGLLKIASYNAAQQQAQNEQLPESQDLMYHQATWEKMKQILESGYLASRKAQIERFGISNLTSGRVKVGKDYVELPHFYGIPKRMTLDEFAAYQKTQTGTFTKQSGQEAHQICFAKEEPYVGKVREVALAFSKAQLLGQTQFMVDDGWHLFPADYDSNDPESSPGLEIDLQQQPMMVVVNEKMRDEFVAFVTSTLAKNDNWKDRIGDPEKWMEENVIFVKHDPHPDIPEEEIYSPQNRQLVKDRFFHRHTDQIRPGRFMPTGNTGDSPVLKPIPLWNYQQAS